MEEEQEDRRRRALRRLSCKERAKLPRPAFLEGEPRPGGPGREPGDPSPACPGGGGRGLLSRGCCSSLRARRELWAALELLSLRGGQPGSWREQLPKVSGAMPRPSREWNQVEANQDQMESAFQQVRVVSEMKEKHGSGSTTCSPWGVTQKSEVGVRRHLRAPAVQAHLQGGKEEVSGSAGTTFPIALCHHRDGEVLWVAGGGGPPSPRPPPCPLPRRQPRSRASGCFISCRTSPGHGDSL